MKYTLIVHPDGKVERIDETLSFAEVKERIPGCQILALVDGATMIMDGIAHSVCIGCDEDGYPKRLPINKKVHDLLEHGEKMAPFVGVVVLAVGYRIK